MKLMKKKYNFNDEFELLPCLDSYLDKAEVLEESYECIVMDNNCAETNTNFNNEKFIKDIKRLLALDYVKASRRQFESICLDNISNISKLFGIKMPKITFKYVSKTKHLNIVGLAMCENEISFCLPSPILADYLLKCKNKGKLDYDSPSLEYLHYAEPAFLLDVFFHELTHIKQYAHSNALFNEDNNVSEFDKFLTLYSYMSVANEVFEEMEEINKNDDLRYYYSLLEVDARRQTMRHLNNLLKSNQLSQKEKELIYNIILFEISEEFDLVMDTDFRISKLTRLNADYACHNFEKRFAEFSIGQDIVKQYRAINMQEVEKILKQYDLEYKKELNKIKNVGSVKGNNYAKFVFQDIKENLEYGQEC
ncbi:MAG: hypothetical protein IJZ29_04685 [Clostridia bacterium]|nr:hypothetical protein [Clostridia bacterium]